jgi:hypothetical protein
MTFDTPPVYRTYILRFWEERSPIEDKANAWRFSLEDTDTNVRHVFNDLDGLFVFLNRQVTFSS